MDKEYIFKSYISSKISCDPVFKSKLGKDCLQGNAKDEGAPQLFLSEGYKYVLIKPLEINNDENMLFKIACYLFHHPKESNDKHIVYFIGDKNIGENIGKEFSNQILKFISYEEIKNWFPKNIDQIIKLVIRYLLGLQEYYGQPFGYEDLESPYLFCIDRKLNPQQMLISRDYLINIMVEEKYLNYTDEDECLLTLTPKAIAKYQEKENEISKKAFIALKFGPQNEERIRIIKEVISSCGYEPICMDEYQTNNWIMPEIFYQIKVCDFMVADFSIHCDGAYYEAGYALALGKEVIHMCDKREKEKNELHFDVAQKSTVLYEDYDDLKKRLKKRIIATIGVDN